MNKLKSLLNKNKKIIILFFLAGLLIIALYFINSFGTEKVSSITQSPNEIKLCVILENIEGVGESEVFIYEEDNSIIGIVVVCEGANNIMVRNDVINLVSTAFNVDKNIIAIYLMKV